MLARAAVFNFEHAFSVSLSVKGSAKWKATSQRPGGQRTMEAEDKGDGTIFLGVGGVVIHRGRALLIRRGREPLKGEWSIPGGLIELGEELAAGVRRELKEETGLAVKPVQIIATFDRIVKEGRRVRYHFVIDFLEVHIVHYHWPDFNIADSCIVAPPACARASVAITVSPAPVTSNTSLANVGR